jgi:glycosyltransferase involved in cell wall biosynthesis
MPLYNHELYVGEAIRSVLGQSCQDLELIIINDGSTDNSEAVVKRINDRRIRYYPQENRGAHEALNRGIGLALGAYIAILNSDDIYDPSRIEEALKILEYNREVLAVFSYIELINAQGESLGIRRGAEENWLGQSADDSFRDEHDFALDLLAGNFLHTTSNLICRREVFDQIGLFANLRYTHDYEFYLRLCTQCAVALIEMPLLKYRFHETNTLSENAAASRFETALVLADFLLTYDLEKVLGEGPQRFQRLTRLFGSIRTYETERIIMLLLLLGFKGNWEGKFWEVFAVGRQNPFREACIDSLKHSHDLCAIQQALTWQQSQTEIWWRKAEEAENALTWQQSQTEIWWRKAEEAAVAHEQREAFTTELKKRNQEQDVLIEALLAKETALNEILASRQWRWLQKLNRVRYAVRRACGRGLV